MKKARKRTTGRGLTTKTPRHKVRTLVPRPSSLVTSAIVCRCEEVTEEEIRSAIRNGHHSLEEVKRVLRTGMGHCQGRGCLKVIARMIQEETGIPAAQQKLPRPRPPLKPLPLGTLGAWKDE